MSKSETYTLKNAGLF